MKKTILPLALFLLIGTSVYAQETSVTTATFPQKREEIKQRIEEKKNELQPLIEKKREEIKKQISEDQGEIKTKLQFFAQDRVSKVLIQIFERFEAVIIKFDGVVLRLENRITKLDEQNIDTTIPKELLLEAKTDIAQAIALITASKIELQKTLTQETSKEELKKTIEVCKTSLKEVQSSLIAVVISLKNLGETEDELVTVI